MSRPDSTTRILTAPIPGLIISLSIPSILSLVSTQAYQLTDAFFISSLGTGQAAAIAINNSLEQIITMTGTFLCVGASSFVSRNLGSGNKDSANKALSFSFFMSLILGILIMALGLAFMNPLMGFLGANSEIIDYCSSYAKYVLLASPFMVANFVTNKILCAEGRSTYAMIGMMSGAVINIILDPIMIFNMNLGIAGASMATAISKFISFIVLLLPYVFHFSSMSLSWKNAKADRLTIYDIAIIGFPSLLRVLVQNTASIILNNMASGYSTAILAGIATSNRLMAFVLAAIFGMAQGYQPVVGQNWGAKKYKRVEESFFFMTIYAFAIMIVIGLPLFIFAEPLLSLFNSEMDEEMTRAGLLLIRSHCLVLAIEAWISFVNMAYTASGKAFGSAILSLSRQGICYIPVILILPRIIGSDGLALAQSVADIIALLIAIPFAISWVRKVHSLKTSCSEAK